MSALSIWSSQLAVVAPAAPLLPLIPIIAAAVGATLWSLLRPRTLLLLARTLWQVKVYVLVVVLLAGGVIWKGSWVLARVWPQSYVADAGGKGDWPVFRGTLARLGAAPDAAGPTRGRLNWAFGDGGPVFASPAVVGDRVYFSTSRLAVLGDGSGEVICLNADTGKPVWRVRPNGDYRATFSSPAVYDKYLVCGEGLHKVRDALVVCLDRTQGGKTLWTYRTKSHVECTPVIYNRRVYVGAGDDGYYCFELEPDAKGQPRLVWHREGKDYPDAETSLTAFDGRVFAGLGNHAQGKALLVLDADTGKELHRLDTGYPVFSPPAIVQDQGGVRLYIGMGNGDFIKTAKDLGQESRGEVWCLDVTAREQSPRVLWKFPVGDTVLGAVAVAGDEVYFASRDGAVYGLDTSGKLLGRFDTRTELLTSPAVSRECVYVASAAGVLVGLERKTLKPVWESQVGAPGMFFSSPAVAHGRVYVGSQHEGLVCLGEPGDPVVPMWAGRLGGAGVGGNPENSPLPALGAFHWQYPANPDGTPLAGQENTEYLAAPPAALGGLIFAPLAAGPQKGLLCLSADLPADRTPTRPLWLHESALGAFASPVAVGERVLYVDGRPGQEGRHLWCLAARTGQPLWKLPVGAAASGRLLAAAKAVYVQDGAETLKCLDLAGATVWEARVGALTHAPAVQRALLLLTTSEPALAALDAPTGRLLYRVKLESEPRTSPALHNNRIYLGTSAGIECRSLAGGTLLPGWKTVGGIAPGGEFVFTREPIRLLQQVEEKDAQGKVTAGPKEVASYDHQVIAYVSAEGELLFISAAELVHAAGQPGPVTVVRLAGEQAHARGDQALTLGAGDGSVVHRVAGALKGGTPLVGREALLYLTAGRVFRKMKLEGKAPSEQWMEADWLGTPSTPAIVAGGNLYLGMTGWGLVRLGGGQ